MSLAHLSKWYAAQCNGDWEHQYGVRIGTLDNPGWFLDVDLVETAWEGRQLERRFVERSEDDWVAVESKAGKFSAHGGPGNLAEMLELFAAFVDGRPLFEEPSADSKR